MIELENIKYDSKAQTPEEFLVKFQKLAKLAYQDSIPDPVPAVNPDLKADAEENRVAAANDANAERLRFHTRERERQSRRLFIKSMPNWLRIKLLERPEETPVQDLCMQARKTLIVQKLYPVDEWS